MPVNFNVSVPEPVAPFSGAKVAVYVVVVAALAAPGIAASGNIANGKAASRVLFDAFM